MVNFHKDLRFQNDKSSKWLCSFRLVPFIQLCIQPFDGFEAREDLFRSCHEIVQVEPTGGAVAKFFKGGIVSVDLYLVNKKNAAKMVFIKIWVLGREENQ